MPTFDRRSFLQAGSLLLAGGYTRSLFGDEVVATPVFAAQPTFEPTALFLTWQRDPTTTMTVQWIGSEQEGAARPIWFSKAGSGQWRKQPAVPRRYPLSDKWIHRTELSGLVPDTDYVFRVGLDSAEQHFRTMPAKATNTIHFVSGGDAGIGPHPVQTNRVAAAQAPQFVVIGGDLAYENGKDGNVFLEFLKNYSRDVRDGQRLIPMLACIGNHEVAGAYGRPRSDAPFFYAMFDGLFPDAGYASLDFGDYMSLVLLDTNHTTPIEGAQTDWLGARSRSARNARRCLCSIMCRRIHRSGPLVSERWEETWEPGPAIASIGCRCSSATTWMPCSSIMTTRISGHIRFWMVTRTRMASCTWGTGRGGRFASPPSPMRAPTWR